MQGKLSPELVSLMERAIGGLQRLEKVRFMFSSILYEDSQKKLFLINKTPTTPSFLEDWRVYLTLRATARTTLTTGKILRSEAALGPYQTNCLSTCNFKDIQQYYELKQQGPQSVLILSRNFTDKDAEALIDIKQFKPVLIETPGQTSRFATVPRHTLLNDYFLQAERQGGPVLLQFGTDTLNKYFEQEKPIIDFVMLTIFRGKLSSEHIGQPFDMGFSSHYKLAFKSQPFPHELGSLEFCVYSLG